MIAGATQAGEPVHRIREWDSVILDSVSPSAEDRALAELLAQGSRLTVSWLEGGTARVASTSWIGTVRFSTFQVEVEPKLVGSEWNVFRMLAAVEGLDLLKSIPQERRLNLGRAGLFDLLVLLFTGATQRVLQQGAIQDYIEREEALPVLRGRLRIAEQYRRRYGQLDALECRYESFDTDIWENQLLAMAAETSFPFVRDSSVRLPLAQVRSELRQLCSAEEPSPLASDTTFIYHRRNAHYRSAHVWARALINGLKASELFTQTSPSAFAFMVDMNELFERFVARIVDIIGRRRKWTVQTQRRDRSVIVTADGKPYQQVIPDLLVEAADIRLPVDSKYKLYDETHVHPADIYQLAVYAFAYGRESSLRSVLLVYPKSGPTLPPRLRVQSHLHEALAAVVGHALDVSELLDDVEANELQAGGTLEGQLAALL